MAIFIKWFRKSFTLFFELFGKGGNPEAENDKKETPIEVADEEETRRLLLEGIPIYKEFEKRRRKEKERRQKEGTGKLEPHNR